MNGMTDEKKLFHAVVDVINQTCEDDMAACCPETEITRDTDLKLDLGLDSIGLVVLQVNLENQFGIQFDPLEDDFDEIFYRVQDVYRYVCRKLTEGCCDD